MTARHGFKFEVENIEAAFSFMASLSFSCFNYRPLPLHYALIKTALDLKDLNNLNFTRMGDRSQGRSVAYSSDLLHISLIVSRDIV